MVDDFAFDYIQGLKPSDARAQVMKDCPQWLIGSSDELVDRLEMIKDETGISYMVFGPDNPDTFDDFANKVMIHLN